MNGISPSQTELATELSVAQSTAYGLIQAAITKGYLTRKQGKYRALILTAAASTVKQPTR